MMNSLRPHNIFALLDDDDRVAALPLPMKNSLTSLLERGILAALVKVVKPEMIFEFGTYLGESTLLLAENSCAQVYTLDLDNDEPGTLLDGHEKNNLKQSLTLRKMFQGKTKKKQIKELRGDSTQFDLLQFFGKINFILIDGGHHIDVVKTDTENALQMLAKGRPACVVWHDYNNIKYEITAFLDRLSMTMPLFHIQETKYVFYASNCTALTMESFKNQQ